MRNIMNLTGRTINGYSFKERIAEGGMAQVYRAVRVDRSQDEPDIAIKVIAQTSVQEREVRILLRLIGIPHIVPLFDFWKDEELELAFLVMPLMEGTLYGRMNGTPVPLKTVLKWTADIVSGLSWVHAKGFTHRDLKPANLLIAPSGDVVVGDFGIAKVMTGGEITMNESKTLSYAAPEQWKNEADQRTDIFALAVIIYELITGQHPYYDTERKQYIPSNHMDFPSILPLLPTASSALDAVLKRAGAMSPEDRYPDLGAFMTALEAAVESRSLDGATQILTESGQPLTAENPYQGLRAFDEKHQTLFYGREALTQDLLLRLGQNGMGGRFLAVVGPSGSGKSSIVRAALIPALKRGALPSSQHWRYTLMKPGEHPLKELHAALRKSHPSNPGNFMSDLQSDDGLSHALRWLLPDDDERIEQVLVVDQAEELFSPAVPQEEREHFIDSLVRALTETQSRLRCIITLRADFMDRPLNNPDLAELLSKFTAIVKPLTQTELREAIERPLEQVQGRFDPGLVEIMLTDVEGQQNALPLLQYTLAELYDHDTRRGSRLTRQTYQTLGGLRGALSQTADSLYNGLDAAAQHSARQMFLRLVSIVEGAEDTRRRAPRSEVLAVASEGLINQFANSRLLTVDRETMELAHEALLNAWERLQTWRDETREDRLIARRLTQMVEEWGRSKHHTDYLLFGSRLQEYETWQTANTIQLTPQESQFLKQSRAEQDKQLKRTRRTRWISRAAAIGFLVVVSGFGISSVQQRTEIGQQQATLVVQEQELAARLRQVRAGELTIAANNAQDYTETAALLAVCALTMRYSVQADDALVRAVDGLYTEKQLVGYRNLFPTAFNPIPPLLARWSC
jgi:serine/threonine protein kinase